MCFSLSVLLSLLPSSRTVSTSVCSIKGSFSQVVTFETGGNDFEVHMYVV